MYHYQIVPFELLRRGEPSTMSLEKGKKINLTHCNYIVIIISLHYLAMTSFTKYFEGILFFIWHLFLTKVHET